MLMSASGAFAELQGGEDSDLDRGGRLPDGGYKELGLPEHCAELCNF